MPHFSVRSLLAPSALLLIASVTLAAGPATAPSSPPDPAADRLTFLTLQLSSAEESIKAVTAAMKAAGYKANVAADKAEGYAKGNELMDRKGGAPVPWDQFYGKTARSFYIPTSTGSFHAEGNGRRVDAQSEIGLHPIARPKQFDYLYKANNAQAAKAKDEVAKMGRQVDALLARRRKLEAEQSVLWATISWEAIQNLDVSFRPLYRLRLKAAATQASAPIETARVDVLRAMVLFLRTANDASSRGIEAVAKDQEKTLAVLRDQVHAAQGTLQESIFRATQSAEPSAEDSRQIKNITAISKRMTAICKNMTEAYKLALEGDAAQDEPRKLTFRGQLQESLLAFSDATEELDTAITKLAEVWGVRGEAGVESPDRVVGPAAPKPGDSVGSTPAGPAVATAGTPIDLMPMIDVKRDAFKGVWSKRDDGLHCAHIENGKLLIRYSPPDEYDFRVEFTRLEGSGDVVQLFSHSDKSVGLYMASGGNAEYWLVSPKGPPAADNVSKVKSKPMLDNNKRYTSLIKVRKDSITTYLNGREILHYKTDYSEFKGVHDADSHGLGVGAWFSDTVFHSIQIIEVTGQGKPMAK